jgi:sugar phosphate isomerase/epimerase
MKTGVITDGISRDFEHALSVMDEFGLKYAELQFVWDKEVGFLDSGEIAQVKELLKRHDKQVSNICHHIFAGMPMSTKPGEPLHVQHLDRLKRCMEIAHEVGSPNVRILSPKKEQILFGAHGAEQWNVAKGAWDALLPLIAPALDIARDAGKPLVVETGNGTMVNSSWTARKLIDDLDAKETLKVLWDPANNCWCHETAFPDGYDLLRDGYIAHIHIKDVHADTPKAYLEVREMGKGQLASQFQPMADALRADGYDGVVSFESVYHPGDGDFEAGFRLNIGRFLELFG